MSTPVHDEIARTLQARWPEHRVGPSLVRIEALMDLLGHPERACPVIQITGTNGKGSTAIMIESLLLALGLRVGRYSSPHLADLTERIAIDGEPIEPERFDELVADVMPLVELVDAQRHDGIEMTFFEVMTGLAYAAFAEAPVDVAVVEVGLGGRWDATSVVTPAVAVICPIDVDHSHILGATAEEIAIEKAGIIKEGSVPVVAEQSPEVARIIAERAAEVGARLSVAGRDFGLLSRTPGVGGQVLRLDTASGPVGDVVLSLFGAHMAENAALAVGAVEAFLGGQPLAADVISEGLGAVVAPARTEIVRTSPTVVLDTCHNPHGARATVATLTESFAFAPLIGVVAMMRDKDVAGVLAEFEPVMQTIVCTQVASTDRGLTADELGELASEIFGAERVVVAPRVPDAVEAAVGLADAAGPGAGVLIAGSVILAGEARTMLVRERDRSEDAGADDEGEWR